MKLTCRSGVQLLSRSIGMRTTLDAGREGQRIVACLGMAVDMDATRPRCRPRSAAPPPEAPFFILHPCPSAKDALEPSAGPAFRTSRGGPMDPVRPAATATQPGQHRPPAGQSMAGLRPADRDGTAWQPRPLRALSPMNMASRPRHVADDVSDRHGLRHPRHHRPLAPGAENNTEAYIAAVARQMDRHPRATLDLHRHEDRVLWSRRSSPTSSVAIRMTARPSTPGCGWPAWWRAGTLPS